jgi:formylglycine-generating enzyme required for sulfatase activity
MSCYRVLPVNMLVLLTACLPELPDEKPQEGNAAGDCSDDADNDDDGTFDCDDEGCRGSDACLAPAGPPDGLVIAVEPAIPMDGDDLSCKIIADAVDPNGDEVAYTYLWMVDGENAGLDLTVIPAGVTSPGESWTCTVTPTDGVLVGPSASASVTVQRTNAPPSAPEVAIAPESPTESDSLTCTVVSESTDPDGDAVSYVYRWTVDGVDAGVSVAHIEASATSAGQTWSCIVTATDGTASSDSGTAFVRIAAAPACGDGGVAVTTAGIEFVSVCAQTFDMGCTADAATCGTDPAANAMTLTHDYYVGRTEVTQSQFESVMGYNPSYHSSCGGDCPVDTVSWHEAAAYANALSTRDGFSTCYTCSGSGVTVSCVASGNPYACEGYRLPTEAEWEGAARCGEDFFWAGADNPDDVAWYSGNSGSGPHPVGLKRGNACGLFDMTGNAWEWTSDWYSDYAGPVTDPTGGASGTLRVQRGGSWDGAARYVYVWTRSGGQPTDRFETMGLRLARTIR